MNEVFRVENIVMIFFSSAITLLMTMTVLYLRSLRGDVRRQIEGNTKDICDLRERLPLEYVRKEDWIRQDVTINCKLDSLAAKIDELGKNYERNRPPES